MLYESLETAWMQRWFAMDAVCAALLHKIIRRPGGVRLLLFKPFISTEEMSGEVLFEHRH